MRLIDSPAVQREASLMPPEDRAVFLDAIRYDGIYDEVATNMRILLRATGRTQRDVADRMGTSETALSRLLRGRVRKAKIETLVRFAKAIEVDVWDLFADLAAQVPARGGATTTPTQDSPGPVTVWMANVAYPQRFHAPRVTWDEPKPPVVRTESAPC